MKRKTFPRIGFVIKHHNAEANELALELGQLVLNEKRRLILPKENEALGKKLVQIGKTHHPKNSPAKSWRKHVRTVAKKSLQKECDLIVVIGGDGTFLSIARLMSDKSVPILGINMGTLGFLTEVKRTEALDTLEYLLSGRAPKVSERTLLEVLLVRDGKICFKSPIVNDMVVSKAAIARIIGLKVYANGVLMNELRADGLILSTPTGSTAYSLASGGPILDPALPALVLTPICAHSLTQRPVVIPDTAIIEVQVEDRPDHVLMTLDGQDSLQIKSGDRILVRRFKKHKLKLISSPHRDYYALLTEKLRFGMRY